MSELDFIAVNNNGLTLTSTRTRWLQCTGTHQVDKAVLHAYATHLTSLHLPDGRFDLSDRLELEAGLQRPAALIVPLERGLRSRALRLSVT